MEIYGDEILRLELDSSVAIKVCLEIRKQDKGMKKESWTDASPECGKEWIISNFHHSSSRISLFFNSKIKEDVGELRRLYMLFMWCQTKSAVSKVR